MSQNILPSNTEVLNKSPKQAIDADINTLPPLAQSLVKLFSLLGKQISPYRIIRGKNASLKAREAIKIAKDLGFTGNVLRRFKIKNISPLTLPCILFLNDAETCVLTEIKDNKCKIFLPAYENNEKELTIEELQQEYIGYALFLIKDFKEDLRTSSIKLADEKRWFWGVIWHYMPIYRHVFFASILINLIAIASSLFSMNVYDRVVPNNALETLWGLALGVIIAYICDFILKNIRSYFVDTAGRNADVLLSSRLVAHILSMRYADKPESTGVLANNIREFESLREFFSSSTLVSFIDLPFLILFLLLIGYIGGNIVIIPLCAIPLMLLISWILQQYSVKFIEENFKQNMQKNAFLIEILNGLETIKSCSAERNIQENWDEIIGLSAFANSSSRVANSFITTFSSTLIQLVSLGVIIFGVYLIAEGTLTMGGLIACNILAGRAMAPLLQISTMITRLQQSRMTLKTLDILMKTPVENPIEEMQDKVNLTEIERLDMTFNNVEFSYPDALNNTLSDLNFKIKQGERVGIIGKMGSGKSTLAKIFTALYRPTGGNIIINGISANQIDTQDLRTRIGFLPQDVVLFYGSVRDNIALNDKHITDSLILQAAKLAGVLDFINSNPAGLAAQVGERGMNFSGGQRQAIALARALVNEPRMLILDEPTSNMDRASEEILKNRIRKSIGTSTLILITHRLSMLDLVDRLIIIDEGRIHIDKLKIEAMKILREQNFNRQGKEENIA